MKLAATEGLLSDLAAFCQLIYKYMGTSQAERGGEAGEAGGAGGAGEAVGAVGAGGAGGAFQTGLGCDARGSVGADGGVRG